jgi:hypothetical protein
MSGKNQCVCGEFENANMHEEMQTHHYLEKEAEQFKAARFRKFGIFLADRLGIPDFKVLLLGICLLG